MTPFTTLSSIAIPLLRDNIDTDAIIPSREMRSTGRTGLADGLFAPWRYRDVDARLPDPAFPLNDARAAGAQILLGGANFGCGSSREHAVWALAEWGIRAVIAPSFAPIFKANALRNGLLPVELPAADWAWRPVAIDLAAQTANGVGFGIDAEAKLMLLEGLDAIALTLKSKAAIDAWEAADRQARAWVYLGSGPPASFHSAPPHPAAGGDHLVGGGLVDPPQPQDGEVAPEGRRRGGAGGPRAVLASTKASSVAKPTATIHRARTLRAAMSLPEVQLWQALRARPGGLKFRRQHPAGAYVLDYYSPAARLCVEIDGASHNARTGQDAARDAWLAAQGITTLRLPAALVLDDVAAAVATIVAAAMAKRPPAVPPASLRSAPPHPAAGGDHLVGVAPSDPPQTCLGRGTAAGVGGAES